MILLSLASLLISFLGSIALFFLKRNPEPLLNIYNLPGKWYWLKFFFMKFVIGHRQKKSAKAAQSENLMASEFGGTGKREVDELEKKHELPSDKSHAVDAVFFDGANKDGWYFTLGTAQRHNNVINLFFILRIPNAGTFVVPEMLTNTNVESLESGKEWKTKSGFTVSCIESMRKWRISYDGNVVSSPGQRIFEKIGDEDLDPLAELIPAKFELEWVNFGDHFDFDQEVSPTSIAHSLAIEPWSRELFNKLKASHQTHYEQFGTITGSFVIAGRDYGKVSITSMRDHTIASYRRWSDIRRYIMMIYHLEDGTCIHTSVISMPETVFTHLEFGYVITADKKKYPVDRIHFQLPHHGEDKNFPKKFHYTFDAAHLHYDVEVAIIDSVSFKMGLDQACQVNENMAVFKANGLNGYGFAEVEYRIAPY